MMMWRAEEIATAAGDVGCHVEYASAVGLIAGGAARACRLHVWGWFCGEA